jgi:hypothetical protein
MDPEDAERLWQHPHVQDLIKAEREFIEKSIQEA